MLKDTLIKKYKLSNLYLGLKFSFSYFTVFPIFFKDSDDLSQKEVLSFMLISLPFVGLVLGTVTIFLFSFLIQLEWYGALISAIVYMLLYGFLHTEAIMDVADAIYAAHSGKDAYVIIKEPTVGAMGVLYAVAGVILKLTSIVYLLTHGFLMEFVAILIVSRLSLLLLFKVHDFRSSFATALKKSSSTSSLLVSFLLFSLLGSLFVYHFVLLLFIGLILALVLSFAIKSKIGFVNGDVLGATLEGVEILLFIGVVI
jgi:adenosylcobinamide-GDP ribazoletransferase